ncbi:hypothetical protein SCUCBS95973_004880 [Sporothrix curviconia]|uniref:Uncharacterized protein n=1 Tax=Sporothrix curviconia TaxID=1260050 RepID=A0ABP0BS54_9PEZI
MATDTLPQLLEALQKSVTSVADATPKLSALTPPEDGLSLLDVKNELLLSYLEHMIFLILIKLRGASSKSSDAADLSLSNSDLGQSVVKKLVELRLYLEKGVRPLEEKLRYQVEKALRAAEEVERTAKQKADAAEAAAKDSDDESGSGSDSDSGSGSDAGGNDNEEDEEEVFGNEEESAASRPNRGAFVRPASSTAAAAAKARTGTAGDEGGGGGGGGGVYRPPKIAPTMMPTTERRERAARRGPLKSATMDEFIADELSSAPLAELSVGANIAGRGRHMTTASERQREEDRRAYEEGNFVRLPKAGKKERAKQAAERGSSSQMSFGGEEWRGLGEGVDRINRLTQRKSGGSSGGAGGARSMLDRSRKRGIDTIDGPRGSGTGAGHEDNMVGGRFNKKLRLHQVGRRDRGKK